MTAAKPLATIVDVTAPPNTPPAISIGDLIVYVVSRYITSPGTVTAVHDNEYGQIDCSLSAVVYDFTDFDAASFHRQVVQKLRPEQRGKVRYCDPTVIWKDATLLTQSRENFVNGIQGNRVPDRVRRTVPFAFVNLEPGTWFRADQFAYEIRCLRAAWDQRIAANQSVHHDAIRKDFGPYADFTAAHKKWWKHYRQAGPPGMGYKWDAIDPQGAMGVSMWARRVQDAVAVDEGDDGGKKTKRRS
jgi:hypothetical protein